MKKIIGIMALFAAACSSYALCNVVMDSTVDNVTFHSSNGDLLTTGDGYVVSFWWSQTGEEDSFQAFGLSGFIDAASWAEEQWNGMFWYSSLRCLTAAPNEESFFQIRIFQTDVSDFTFDDDGGVYSSGVLGDSVSLDIAALWEEAITGTGETGVWSGSVMTDPEGVIGGIGTEGPYCTVWFGWSMDEKIYLTASEIPEPSAYAAVFGVLVAAFAGYRRMK